MARENPSWGYKGRSGHGRPAGWRLRWPRRCARVGRHQHGRPLPRPGRPPSCTRRRRAPPARWSPACSRGVGGRGAAADVPRRQPARPAGFRGYREGTTSEFVVDSQQRLVEVGVGGEALRLPPPLRFRVVAGVLRVRLPAGVGAPSRPWHQPGLPTRWPGCYGCSAASSHTADPGNRNGGATDDRSEPGADRADVGELLIGERPSAVAVGDGRARSVRAGVGHSPRVMRRGGWSVSVAALLCRARRRRRIDGSDR